MDTENNIFQTLEEPDTVGTDFDMADTVVGMLAIRSIHSATADDGSSCPSRCLVLRNNWMETADESMRSFRTDDDPDYFHSG